MRSPGWFICLVCALLAGGFVACSSNGGAPSSIAGTWEFEIVGGSCPDLNSGLLNPGSGPPAVFQVNQSGLNVSAQFVDQGGGACTFAAQYSGDQVRGLIEVNHFGRTVIASVEGYARVVGGQRFVDGWARIDFDSENQCVGEIIEFCAKVFGEGGEDPVLVQCPPVDIVFVMDTSGSMNDEAAALCAEIQNVADELTALGLESIRTVALGITENADEANSGLEPETPYACLSNSVLDLLGESVPGTPLPAQADLDDSEDWAPGSTIVASRFNWRTGALRIIVPISDEGPEDGGADDPGDCDPGTEELFEHQSAVFNLIVVARQNQAIVSPIISFNEGQLPCVFQFAQEIAFRTGGTAIRTTDPTTAPATLADAIFDIVTAACEGGTTLPPLPEPPTPPGSDPPPPPLTDAQIIAQCPDVDLVFLIDTSGSMLDDIFLMCGGDLRDVVQFSTTIPVPLNVVGALDQVEARLTALGANVNSRILGITEDGAQARQRLGIELPNLGLPPPPSIAFDCIGNGQTVVNLLTDQVPVHPSISGPILFETDIDNGAPGGQTGVEHAYESWGSAIAIVANADGGIVSGNGSFWRPGALRIVVPVSDEGPERGMSLPPTQIDSGQDGDCDAADAQAVTNAIAVAQDNGVIVAGIAAFLINAPNPQGIFHPCVTNEQGTGEMDRLAAATGGVVTRSVNLTTLVNDILSQTTNILNLPNIIQDITAPLEDAIYQIVLESCRTAVVRNGIVEGNEDDD